MRFSDPTLTTGGTAIGVGKLENSRNRAKNLDFSSPVGAVGGYGACCGWAAARRRTSGSSAVPAYPLVRDVAMSDLGVPKLGEQRFVVYLNSPSRCVAIDDGRGGHLGYLAAACLQTGLAGSSTWAPGSPRVSGGRGARVPVDHCFRSSENLSVLEHAWRLSRSRHCRAGRGGMLPGAEVDAAAFA